MEEDIVSFAEIPTAVQDDDSSPWVKPCEAKKYICISFR